MTNQDKLVVVTGGSKGIGKAIVKMFAQEGFSIVSCARGEDSLQQLKREVESEFNSKIHVISCDLAKKEGVEDFIDFVKLLGKPIEVLVNNTGVFVPGQIHEEEQGVLERLMETNVYSAYHLSRGVIPLMKEAKRGYIFNICSTASIMAYENGGSYCITKFAMYGMSKVLRAELKEYGIKVSSLLPGATFTSSWDGVDLEEDRLMKPEDVADMVLATYRLSDRAVVEDILIRPQLGDL
ncbi:MAG: SDR family oxidoreductase [Cyclobacteriaceae bacterium]|nr:SDR family oxidoreductase [Cyclobacteriaceae bacterium HetDA_MAG_MS6]